MVEQNKAQDTDDTDDIRAGVLISPFTSLEDVMMGYWGVRWLLGTRLECESHRTSCALDDDHLVQSSCPAFLRSRLGPKFDSLLALQVCLPAVSFTFTRLYL